jgi:16S rRNA processing protein RimM
VLLAPYNAESTGLERVQRLWLSGREYKVSRAERVNLGYLFALEGVTDRDQADGLRGQEALVDRSELPDLPEGEMYAIDLVGFTVAGEDGKEHGVVEDIEEAGPQDLLRLQGGALVPLSLVREVSQEGRRVIIHVPEGLFEL